MSQDVLVSGSVKTDFMPAKKKRKNSAINANAPTAEDLATSITRASSSQTYYTIRLLADRDRVADAYRAYGYFRWVDDKLDEQLHEQSERSAFVERQQSLIHRGYRGQTPADLTQEERMLIALIHGDTAKNSGVQSYIRNMMAVMAFDADRQWRLITQKELDDYSRHLALAVTDALHYFIGHDRSSPQGRVRYHAVTAAHITHMLRDTIEDADAGYFNISQEFLNACGLDPRDVHHPAYKEWVRSRVQLARTYFESGRDNLAQVESRRCRVAGHAYITRFEVVLDAIERDNYHLRPAYPERKGWKAALRVCGAALNGAVRSSN